METKFAVENHQDFSKTEVVFTEGYIERLLWEIPLWIKVLLVE